MGANGERRNVNSNRQDRGSRVITEIALGRAELAILVFTFSHARPLKRAPTVGDTLGISNT